VLSVYNRALRLSPLGRIFVVIELTIFIYLSVSEMCLLQL
jgi:hypothetical protein